MQSGFLRVFSATTALMTVFLLFAGALVTSTGSGLAVPDWPLSFGTLFPEMVGGVFYEHGHRLVAGTVAILTLVQAVAFYRVERRSWVKRLALFAFVLVLFQALLGGMTVLLRLPPQVSISHAVMAQLFFCTAMSLALVSSRRWFSTWAYDTDYQGVFPLALLLTLLFFIQLILGATLRHYGAALAIPDFPLSFGGWIPNQWSFGIAVNFTHRSQAYLIAVVAAVVASQVFRRYERDLFLVANGGLILMFLSIQILLGAFVIWAQRPVIMTSLHLVNGALCLASSFVLTVQLYRIKAGRKA